VSIAVVFSGVLIARWQLALVSCFKRAASGCAAFRFALDLGARVLALPHTSCTFIVSTGAIITVTATLVQVVAAGNPVACCLLCFVETTAFCIFTLAFSSPFRPRAGEAVQGWFGGAFILRALRAAVWGVLYNVCAERRRVAAAAAVAIIVSFFWHERNHVATTVLVLFALVFCLEASTFARLRRARLQFFDSIIVKGARVYLARAHVVLASPLAARYLGAVA
jgi:hypothetical protein